MDADSCKWAPASQDRAPSGWPRTLQRESLSSSGPLCPPEHLCVVSQFGGPGPSLGWGGTVKAGKPQSSSVALRVEEVNWASWEQTLPTLCEDPSGAGVPRK